MLRNKGYQIIAKIETYPWGDAIAFEAIPNEFVDDVIEYYVADEGDFAFIVDNGLVVKDPSSGEYEIRFPLFIYEEDDCQ